MSCAQGRTSASRVHRSQWSCSQHSVRSCARHRYSGSSNRTSGRKVAVCCSSNSNPSDNCQAPTQNIHSSNTNPPPSTTSSATAGSSSIEWSSSNANGLQQLPPSSQLQGTALPPAPLGLRIPRIRWDRIKPKELLVSQLFILVSIGDHISHPHGCWQAKYTHAVVLHGHHGHKRAGGVTQRMLPRPLQNMLYSCKLAYASCPCVAGTLFKVLRAPNGCHYRHAPLHHKLAHVHCTSTCGHTIHSCCCCCCCCCRVSSWSTGALSRH